MTTFLVTGAAGFIGSNLCDRLLAEGKRVVGVDDLSRGRIANLAEARGYGQQFTFYNMDIRADGIGALFERHRPEVVMHLAAQVGVRPSLKDPVHDASINLMGLLNVLEGAVAAEARKVVFASSGSTIYGDPKSFPVKESARKASRPSSPNGIAKKVAEEYLAYYRRRRGLDFTALALGNVYGPRQDADGEGGVVAIFGGRMLRGEKPTIFGTGEQTRDYVFVDDAVHAFSLAADNGSGSLVNIGTGLETSVKRLFQLLAGIIGYRGEPLFGPAQEGEVPRLALAIEGAERDLGWRPWTHLEDGLAETISFLRGG